MSQKLLFLSLFLIDIFLIAFAFNLLPQSINQLIGLPGIDLEKQLAAVILPKEEKGYEGLKEEKEEFERLTIERLEKEVLPQKEIIKEVAGITKIDPIKEIAKEKIVEKISNEELTKKNELSSFAALKEDIENFRKITQKLQAHPPSLPQLLPFILVLKVFRLMELEYLVLLVCQVLLEF